MSRASLVRWLSASPRRRRSVSGQVSTFLIFLMVIVLILTMFITNLGQLSNTVVNVANAADASALSLGSQLATTSNQLCKSLSEQNREGARQCDPGPNGTKFCRKTGLLGVILAVVVAVVLIIVTWGSLSPVAAGIIGGAIGGAVGGGIVQDSWKGAALGAIQGAMIGAAIGGGAAALGPHTVALAGPTLSGEALTGTTAGFLGMGAATAATTAVALVGASNIYTQSRTDHDIRVNMAAISQSLSGLPDYERIRESTLLNAMGMLVDDPNTTVGPNGGGGCFFPSQHAPAVGDPFDVDGDGNTSEAISCLDYWWSVRVNALQKANQIREKLVRDFIEGPLTVRRDSGVDFLYTLERGEVEDECEWPHPPPLVPSEGEVIQVLRRVLEAGPTAAQGYILSHWKPGPMQAAVRAIYDDPCEPSCAPMPPEWDPVDNVRRRYEQFIDYANALIWNPLVQGSQGSSGTLEGYRDLERTFGGKDAWYKHLAQTTDTWFPMLYVRGQEDSPTAEWGPNSFQSPSFYSSLNNIRMTLWQMAGNMNTIVKSILPKCNVAWGTYPENEALWYGPPDQPVCDNNPIPPNPPGTPRAVWNGTYRNRACPTCALVTGVHHRDSRFSDDWASYFPGPVCAIRDFEIPGMLDQLARAREFVKSPNLENFIKSDPGYHFNNASCADDDDQLTGAYNVDQINWVALPKWKNNGPNPDGDVLEYNYSYSFECQVCEPEMAGDPPEPTGNTVCNNDYYWDSRNNTRTYGGLNTPDFHIPAVPRDGQGGFLDIVNIMDIDFLDFWSKFSARPYGTIDFDASVSSGGLQGTVKGHEFLRYFDAVFGQAQLYEGENEKVIQRFLMQTQALDQALQNAQLTIPLAEDGRLPNPQQPYFDPIAGSTHPIDGKYTWQDTSGVHTVTVEIGPFLKPIVKTTKTGNWLVGKTCLELRNYCENTPNCPYSLGPDRTWVRITRQEPTNKSIGFWKWNPFAGTIRKISRAAFDRLYVGTCSTGAANCP